MFKLIRKPSVLSFTAVPATYATVGMWVWGATVNISGLSTLRLSDGVRLVKGDVISRVEDIVVVDNAVIQYRAWMKPVPARPAVAPKTETIGATGWDAGARSIKVIGVGQSITFKISAVVAAIAGISSVGYEYSYATANYAFLVRPGQYFGLDVIALVSGEERSTVINGIPTQYLSNIDLTIKVTKRSVQFIVNGYVEYEEERSDSEIYFDIYATPYSIADYILVSEIEEAKTSVKIEMPSVKCLIQEERVNSVFSPIQALQMYSGRSRESKVIALLPSMLSKIHDNKYKGKVSGNIVFIKSKILKNISYDIGSVYIQIPSLYSSIRGTAGLSAKITTEIPGVIARLGNKSSSRVNTHLGLYVSSKFEFRSRNVFISMLGVSSFTSITSAVVLVSMDSLAASSNATIMLILELSSIDELELGDDATIGSIVNLLSMERVAVNSSISADLQKEALQYAVNLATGATSKYEGFDFSGFVSVGDQSYAWRNDGLYHIGRGREPIRSLIDFGVTDFGAQGIKRADTAWIGVRTDGEAYLKISTDGSAPLVYKVLDSNNYGMAHLAKGASGRFWGLKLNLEESSYAAVDSVEVRVGLSQRRFNRR